MEGEDGVTTVTGSETSREGVTSVWPDNNQTTEALHCLITLLGHAVTACTLCAEAASQQKVRRCFQSRLWTQLQGPCCSP